MKSIEQLAEERYPTQEDKLNLFSIAKQDAFIAGWKAKEESLSMPKDDEHFFELGINKPETQEMVKDSIAALNQPKEDNEAFEDLFNAIYDELRDDCVLFPFKNRLKNNFIIPRKNK